MHASTRGGSGVRGVHNRPQMRISLAMLLLASAGLAGSVLGSNGMPADAVTLLRSALGSGRSLLGAAADANAATLHLATAQRELLRKLSGVVDQLHPNEIQSFWAKLQLVAQHGGPSDAGDAAAADSEVQPMPAASRRQAQTRHTIPTRNGTALQSDTRRGWCLGGIGNGTEGAAPFRGNFSLEVDDANDLSLLVAYVLATLIEDKLGFEVNLVARHFIDHSIERVARGDVDASVEIQLTEAREKDIYTRLVEIEELALDLGPTGYSNSAGWYVANGHVITDEELCLHQDHWHTLTHTAALGAMLTANEVAPGVNFTGGPVCDIARGDPLEHGYCPPTTGKYFSRACTASGFSTAVPGRPCRALLAHYPSYDVGVNEQLVNNLGGDGLEFGVVYLGYNASNEIMARAARGETFLFHHWHPSPLLAAGNFTQVHTMLCTQTLRGICATGTDRAVAEDLCQWHKHP